MQVVLVVEDDDSIAVPLVRGLEREGYEVRRVTNGTEALADPGADVVLLDLGLPDLDGFEVLRRLRARSDVPVIVLTARGDEVDRVVGLELGGERLHRQALRVPGAGGPVAGGQPPAEPGRRPGRPGRLAPSVRSSW